MHKVNQRPDQQQIESKHRQRDSHVTGENRRVWTSCRESPVILNIVIDNNCGTKANRRGNQRIEAELFNETHQYDEVHKHSPNSTENVSTKGGYQDLRTIWTIEGLRRRRPCKKRMS